MSEDNPAIDNDDKPQPRSTSAMEENLRSTETWVRLLFIVLLYVLASLASMVLGAIVIIGFFWVLLTGEVNSQLKQAGQGIARYFYQVVRYLTFNTDERPFPFGGEWPSADTDQD